MKESDMSKNNCCNESGDKKGLFIAQRELSWVVAALISTALFVFLAGYFWGQRRAVSTLLEKIEKESFADKVTYSLYTMNGKYQPDDQDEEDDDQDSDDETPSETVTQTQQAPVDVVNPIGDITDVSQTIDAHEPIVTYMAPLVGFGSLSSANQFMQKVKKSGIDVSVKKRVSKTPKGKTVAWYQVVTGEYADKNEIEHVVMRLSEKENLKNVKIVEIKKG